MLYKPIKYYLMYIGITLFISFFGPAKYYNYDKTSVFIYISFFAFCIFSGYYIGLRIRPRSITNKTYSDDVNLSNKKRIIKLIKIAIIVSVIGVSIEIVEILIRSPYVFSISQIGSNYISIRENLDMKSGYSLGLLIRFFTGFFRNLVMTAGIFYFKKLPINYKGGIILYYILSILVNGIAYGTQKVLGDMFIFACVVAFLKMKGINRNKQHKIYGTIICLAIILVIYIASNQVQRYDQIGITAFNYGDNTVNGLYYDTDNLIFKIFGYKFGFGLAALLTGYMSAGYYGLSLCLTLPFKWTYGVGSSLILSKFLNQNLGLPNLYYDTYLYRMEMKYGRLGADAWNTIFPWLASDLTFYGAVVIFIPIGMLFALSWKETICYENPVSLLMVSTIILGLIFVPCNNQLFIGIDGFISTWITFFFWIFTHRKYNHNEELIYDNQESADS